MTAFPKTKRDQNAEYLEYVRTKPCICCLTERGIIAHHFMQAGSGMATKPDDLFTAPLCVLCHAVWHNEGILPCFRGSIRVLAVEKSRCLQYRSQARLLAEWIRLGDTF